MVMESEGVLQTSSQSWMQVQSSSVTSFVDGRCQGHPYGLTEQHLHAPAKAVLSGHHKGWPVVDFHKRTASLALTRFCEAPPEEHAPIFQPFAMAQNSACPGDWTYKLSPLWQSF